MIQVLPLGLSRCMGFLIVRKWSTKRRTNSTTLPINPLSYYMLPSTRQENKRALSAPISDEYVLWVVGCRQVSTPVRSRWLLDPFFKSATHQTNSFMLWIFIILNRGSAITVIQLHFRILAPSQKIIHTPHSSLSAISISGQAICHRDGYGTSSSKRDSKGSRCRMMPSVACLIRKGVDLQTELKLK